ncbi:MAG: hypothetical protein G01um101419_524 [Parcubacteria group bacterium Gr01-1014_19]|nr:MAG: hypothetical protein G01um101419_524 [Parcubacteria group bacterium Gr01-1014_19]
MPKKIFAAVLALCTLFVSFGCDKVSQETSETIFEPAEVVELYHSPARDEQYQDVELQYKYDFWDGEWKWMPVSVTKTRHIAENWQVAFRCKHGQFMIGKEGHNQFKTKELYEKLKKGQKVTVSYTEKYRVVTDKDTGKQTKTLVDMDFLDAVDAGTFEGK